jgi:hypothetical protein
LSRSSSFAPSISVLLGITLMVAGAYARSASHIRIVRDVYVDTPNLYGEPVAIKRTADGGYVFAGAQPGTGPQAGGWAMRVDAAGRPRWLFKAWDTQGGDSVFKSSYTGIAVLPDDSIVLCGTATERGDSWHFGALITHLGKDGNLIKQATLRPQDDLHARGSARVFSCEEYGSGAIALGHIAAGRAPDRTQTPSANWIVVLDGNAERKSERLLQLEPSPRDDRPRFLVLPDSELLVLAPSAIKGQSGMIEATRLYRLSTNGGVSASRDIGGFALLASSPSNREEIPLLLLSQEGERNEKLEIAMLDANWNARVLASATGFPVIAYRAYRLSNGSIAIFGQSVIGGSSVTASITWLDPRLHRETVVFEPHFASIRMGDAVPTGQPDEFMAVRAFAPIANPGADDRTGFVLSLIHFQ